MFSVSENEQNGFYLSEMVLFLKQVLIFNLMGQLLDENFGHVFISMVSGLFIGQKERNFKKMFNLIGYFVFGSENEILVIRAFLNFIHSYIFLLAEVLSRN